MMNFLNKNKNTDFPQTTDKRIHKLIRIIVWQGRVIVLLIASLVIISVFRFNDINMPSQEALQTAPPLTREDLQYAAFVYHDTRLLKHGDAIDQPDVVLMGQVYDWQEVQCQWQEFYFLINDAAIPLDQNGTYNIEFKLQPGPNVIETGIRLNGESIMRRQNVIIYQQPEPSINLIAPTSTVVATSTQS